MAQSDFPYLVIWYWRDNKADLYVTQFNGTDIQDAVRSFVNTMGPNRIPRLVSTLPLSDGVSTSLMYDIEHVPDNFVVKVHSS